MSGVTLKLFVGVALKLFAEVGIAPVSFAGVGISRVSPVLTRVASVFAEAMKMGQRTLDTM